MKLHNFIFIYNNNRNHTKKSYKSHQNCEFINQHKKFPYIERIMDYHNFIQPPMPNSYNTVNFTLSWNLNFKSAQFHFQIARDLKWRFYLEFLFICRKELRGKTQIQNNTHRAHHILSLWRWYLSTFSRGWMPSTRIMNRQDGFEKKQNWLVEEPRADRTHEARTWCIQDQS